jgi:hypothetical protein
MLSSLQGSVRLGAAPNSISGGQRSTAGAAANSGNAGAAGKTAAAGSGGGAADDDAGTRVYKHGGRMAHWACCAALLPWLACSSGSQQEAASAGAAGAQDSNVVAGASGTPVAGSFGLSNTAGSSSSAGHAAPSAMRGSGGSGGGNPPPSAASAGSSGGAGTSMPAAGTQAGGPSAGMAGSDAGAAAPPVTVVALPAITDPGANGPFETEIIQTVDGLSTHVLIAPKELGRDGIKHPVVVWINGASLSYSSYRQLLVHVAAHGFFVIADKQSSFDSAPEVEAQHTAIEWAVKQAELQGGPYAGKIDPTRLAIAGHSLGSVSTFGNVSDPRVTTSIHMAGGITGNPEGIDESWLQNMRAPAAFLAGSADSNGLPRCKDDFAAAPAAVPLFLGILAGVGHLDEFGNANGGRWGRFLVAWLRWQLAGDSNFEKSFVGADCEFCKGDWTAMKHVIN